MSALFSESCLSSRAMKKGKLGKKPSVNMSQCTKFDLKEVGFYCFSLSVMS